MNATSEKAKAIFVDLIGNVPPLEWDARLKQVCDGDDALLRRVTDLLSAHVKEGSFLDEPAIAVDVTVDHKAEAPGTTIGPYKLRELIGEGGMGVVYVAEQSHPVRRKVALKVIKPGMDTKQVVARFEAERQALAMMDHPNIAKVHDGGTTESGRPYFVMELVPGVPITEYCDGERLSVRQRLELFVLVCRAVQHAHQKGIIHRDLKPSNILVTLHDGVPVPKVIDFGVAKAMGQSLTDKTVYTALSQLVGTPLYMSPEQAEMNQLGVDTRSDVYSLGVLLYELLTGTTPFNKEALGGSGLEEMRRMIREVEPPRPSARVSSLQPEALSTTSQRRGTDPRRISAALHGELDWIVMKSLEKDRGRRYESAGAFATDVRRYLDDEPVLAGPPSTMYKFHKFARKHRAALATAVAIAASLILGTTASAWQAVRATTAEAQANANATQAQEKAQEATTQRDEAQKQRDEVRALNDKLLATNEKLQATQAELRSTLYAAHMNVAQHAWEAGDIRRVRELLERHRPHPEESDLRAFEWHYLNRLCHQELLTLHRGSRPADDVAYSPDGKRLAAITFSGEKAAVRVWDAQTGRELLALEGVFGPVAFSPDGKRLATGARSDRGAAVKMWDAQTGQELTTLHTGSISSVAFSPDGKRLACGSTTRDPTKRVEGAGEVKVWDVQTDRELLVLKGHTGEVSVAYSPDGKRLASAGQKPGQAAKVGEVKVWDAETGQEVFTVEAPGYYDRPTVAYSPDGKRLASAGTPSTVKVWDAQTGRELLTIKTHGLVTRLAFSPDGKRLVTGAAGGTSGAVINRAVRVWDAETGQELYSLKGHANQVTSVAFSPDGSRLASTSRDGTVKVWDATTSPEARALPGGILSPDGKHLAGAVGNEVKVWETQTGRETLTLTGHTGRVRSVAFSPDGRRLVSAAADWTVKVWDAQTGQEQLTFKAHAGPVDDRDSVDGGMGPVAFSPDGRRVASGNSFGVGTGRKTAWTTEVKVWDAQTGREVVTYKGHTGSVTSVAFSPDGKRLASAARKVPGAGVDEIKVWDAETGQELHTFPSGGSSVAFSPDGRRIAGAGKRQLEVFGPSGWGEIKVWDAETGRELLTLQGHTSDVWNVAFSPDGQRLASGSPFDPMVRVWDAQTGQQLLALKGEGERGDYLAFSRDGHWLVGYRQLWDATPLPEK